MVELENIEGIMKLSRDISSKRLFCRGVPVSSRRCSACREREGGRHALLREPEGKKTDIKKRPQE